MKPVRFDLNGACLSANALAVFVRHVRREFPHDDLRLAACVRAMPQIRDLLDQILIDGHVLPVELIESDDVDYGTLEIFGRWNGLIGKMVNIGRKLSD